MTMLKKKIKKVLKMIGIKGTKEITQETETTKERGLTKEGIEVGLEIEVESIIEADMMTRREMVKTDIEKDQLLLPPLPLLHRSYLRD